MEQIVKKISTYSADWAGVCSAFYELGGMIVIHDASGCNSTYTTFDEPRWYQMNCLFFISGLTEMDAVLGNEEKLAEDIVKASKELQPKFIAIVGSPIPHMMGTDFEGLARRVEHRTNIPVFGFDTNGMNDYCIGGANAFEALARRFCVNKTKANTINKKDLHKITVNILGVTPLDFSIIGNAEALRQGLEDGGYAVNSVWAMNTSLKEIEDSVYADVNVVVSALGIKAARYLKDNFQIPYVIGLPCGKAAMEQIWELINKANTKKENQYLSAGESKGLRQEKVLIIGEPIKACGIRYCLREEFGFKEADVLSPLKTESFMHNEGNFMLSGDNFLFDEHLIKETMETYDLVIGDPMYRPLLPEINTIIWISLPQEAFSSRIYRKEAPIFIGGDFTEYIQSCLAER